MGPIVRGVTMALYLLDTGVLIRHLRRYPGYETLFKNLNRAGSLYIATFTRVEIICGMRDHEREQTMTLLDAMLSQPLDRKTADTAGEMMRTYRSKGIT